jgi:hypothetical protein
MNRLNYILATAAILGGLALGTTASAASVEQMIQTISTGQGVLHTDDGNSYFDTDTALDILHSVKDGHANFEQALHDAALKAIPVNY